MFSGKIPRYAFIASMVAVPSALFPQSPAVDISLDPRVELLAIVGYLGGYRNVNLGDTPYGFAIERRFGAFRDHPAVKLFASLHPYGFSYDGPVDLILRHSDPPGLFPRTGLSAELRNRFESAARNAKLKVKPDDFIALLRDFSEKTRFMDFFAKQVGIFRPLTEKISEYLEDGRFAGMMTKYFGVDPGNFHVILSPLQYGGYGPRVERGDGSFDMYNVCGPNRYSDESVPDYGTREDFLEFSFHEFGHSFVNPVTEQYLKDVNKYSSLFAPIKDAMTSMAYPYWYVCVNEHLVRASVIRLMGRTAGAEAARTRLDAEYGRGFIYIRELVAALERYEANRTSYPSFASFYPELLKVFAGLKLNGPSGVPAPSFTGPINAAVLRPGKAVMIVPTHEASDALNDGIRKYVELIREKFFRNAELLTDDQALKRDLSDRNLIVYGTPGGNSWLARNLPHLPVKITRDGITAGKYYPGDRLRFITSVRNPGNPAFALTVYTAQNGEDVSGINAVFHGPTDFVVADGTIVLEAGVYRKEGASWSCPGTEN